MHNYKEIAKTNTFIAHAKEIQKICKERFVDIGVAADMWIADNGITRTEELMKQYQDYRRYCREDTLYGIVKELEK